MAVTWVASVEKRSIEGKRKVHRVRLTTAASGNTYNTGGDSPPSFGNMGFKRNMDYLIFVDTAADGYEYKYNITTGKIMVYHGDNPAGAAGPSLELGGAAAFNSKNIVVEAVGW